MPLFGRDFVRYMASPDDPGEGYDLVQFDFDRDPLRMKPLSDLYNATDPDLSRFRDRGGKLLMYHGWADSIGPPAVSTAYWDSVTAKIVYLPSGYMAVQIMRDPRPTFAGGKYDTATPTEKVAAIDGYYAYFGTYEVDARSRTVTHTVQASLRPNEVGLRYERRFELVGDRLTLTTPPFDEAGESRVNRLVWERIK